MNPSPLVLLALLATAIGGCIDAEPTTDDTQAPALMDGVTVHRPAGGSLDDYAAPEAPRFQHLPVGERSAHEPIIEFDLVGNAYYMGGSYLMQSTDNGASWIDVTPSIPILGQEVSQGGDPVLERDGAGRLYYVVYRETCLHVLAGSVGSWNLARVCDAATTDHPTFFWAPVAGEAYPYVLAACYNAATSVRCQRSVDGGQLWTPTPLPFPDVGPGQNPPSADPIRLGWECGILTGFGMGASDGSLYLPKTGCGRIEVAISRDAGQSWMQQTIYDDARLDDQDHHEVKMAEDAAGNLYAVYIDADDRMHMTRSTDQGATWSVPMDVTAPGLTVTKLPTVIAAGAGRVAWSYIASTVADGFDATPEAAAEATWHAYVGMSEDALEEDPIIVTTRTSSLDEPLRRGPCEGRCPPDPTNCGQYGCELSSASGGFYDYLDIDIHPVTGELWLSLVDLCTGACAQPSGTMADSTAQAATVAVQVGGLRL